MKIKKCYLCGHISEHVNHFLSRHVGGQGEVEFPVCDDKEGCMKRQDEANKEWQQARGICHA